jgi:hypothetical protein
VKEARKYNYHICPHTICHLVRCAPLFQGVNFGEKNNKFFKAVKTKFIL